MTSKLRMLSIIAPLCVLLAAPTAWADRKHGDVQNIGNRDINGRIAGIFPNFVSLEKEIQIGAEYAQMF